ncbi:hypothetical protein H8S95_17545 [Pontibacter sp. KCTC 32443]|uniref:hypothetical protein n=1 Tax=Pontibacter TaxID=323449 RepID=UPI00164E8C67|nr:MULTISPECIES: hypothetical protein [Pontibacter]MBC5775883.1 hypothetical protein [Pontibacter sp. KCTC 32443]
MLKVYFNILLLVTFYAITLKSAEGQGKEFDVYNKIELTKRELIADKVDTFLIYTTGCVGCEILYKKGYEPSCECISEGVNASIIWQVGGKSYLKQISCCFETTTNIDELPDVFSFYEKNKSRLQKTEVGIRKVKADGTVIISKPASTSHYSFQEVVMKNGASEYNFEVKDYQKEGEFADAWRKYKWLEAQVKWVNIIDNKLRAITE